MGSPNHKALAAAKARAATFDAVAAERAERAANAASTAAMAGDDADGVAVDGADSSTEGAAGYSRPSKTRLKKQALALQVLGVKLVEQSEAKLATMALPEKLLDAVREARSIRSREGRRRQMQYLGKLMRDIDPALIEASLEEDSQRHRGEVNAMHAAERWRDGLIDGRLSLTELIDRHPAASSAGLAALVAGARRERSTERPPRNSRLLYRALLQIITDDTDGTDHD